MSEQQGINRNSIARIHSGDSSGADLSGLVEVEFIPDQRGARLFKTPSGTRYRFGSERHRLKLVNVNDVDYFKNRPDTFKVRDENGRKPASLELPGVPENLVDHLRTNGWTLESLQKAFLSDLPEVPPEMAKRLIARAQKVAETQESKDNKDETSGSVWSVGSQNVARAPTARQTPRRPPRRPRRSGGG
jgi:hypothetical protein